MNKAKRFFKRVMPIAATVALSCTVFKVSAQTTPINTSLCTNIANTPQYGTVVADGHEWYVAKKEGNYALLVVQVFNQLKKL
jgi:hypothetical protein